MKIPIKNNKYTLGIMKLLVYNIFLKIDKNIFFFKLLHCIMYIHKTIYLYAL